MREYTGPSIGEQIGEGKYNTVHEYPGDPTKVLKILRNEWKEKIVTLLGWKLWTTKDEGVHPLDSLERVQADLDFLQANFGQWLPETQVRMEEGRIVTEQDRIDGPALDQLPFDPAVEVELKEFFSRVVDAYIDSMREHRGAAVGVFPDLKGENFHYGTKRGSNDPKQLFFLDTYPIEGCSAYDYLTGVLPTQRGRFAKAWLPTFDAFQKDAYSRIMRKAIEMQSKA